LESIKFVYFIYHYFFRTKIGSIDIAIIYEHNFTDAQKLDFFIYSPTYFTKEPYPFFDERKHFDRWPPSQS